MESADTTTFWQWFMFLNVVLILIDLVSTTFSSKYGQFNGHILLSYTIRGVVLRMFTVRPVVIFIVMIIAKILLIIINT